MISIPITTAGCDCRSVQGAHALWTRLPGSSSLAVMSRVPAACIVAWSPARIASPFRSARAGVRASLRGRSPSVSETQTERKRGPARSGRPSRGSALCVPVSRCGTLGWPSNTLGQMSRQQTRTETVLMYCSPEVKQVLRRCKADNETFDDAVARVARAFDPTRITHQRGEQ